MDPLSTWASDRRKTIRELKRLGEAIREHAKNAKIASAVGTGTSIVSGVGAAVCYLAVPFTLGASLAPAVGLTGLSIAGAATSVGSSVVNYFIEKDYMKDVQAALDKDRKSYDELKNCVEEAKKFTVAKGAEFAKIAGKKIPDVVKYGSKIATQVAKKLSVSERAAAALLNLGKSARFAGHVVTFVVLPLDIIFFVKDAIDLAKGNVSAAADKVLELAKQLQQEYDETMSDAE